MSIPSVPCGPDATPYLDVHGLRLLEDLRAGWRIAATNLESPAAFEDPKLAVLRRTAADLRTDPPLLARHSGHALAQMIANGLVRSKGSSYLITDKGLKSVSEPVDEVHPIVDASISSIRFQYEQRDLYIAMAISHDGRMDRDAGVYINGSELRTLKRFIAAPDATGPASRLTLEEGAFSIAGEGDERRLRLSSVQSAISIDTEFTPAATAVIFGMIDDATSPETTEYNASITLDGVNARALMGMA